MKKLESSETVRTANKRMEFWCRKAERSLKQLAKERDRHAREEAMEMRMWREQTYDSFYREEETAADCRAKDEEIVCLKAKMAELVKALDDYKAYTTALEHKLSRNSRNSNMPSSQDVPQNRPQKSSGAQYPHTRNGWKSTGKKQDAQPGHQQHPRKKLRSAQEPVSLDNPCVEHCGEQNLRSDNREHQPPA